MEGFSVRNAKLFDNTHAADVRRLDQWKFLTRLASEFPTYLYEAPSGKWYIARVQGSRIENAFRRLPVFKALGRGPINSEVSKKAQILKSAGVDAELPVAELKGRKILGSRKIHITAYIGEAKFPYIKNTFETFFSREKDKDRRFQALGSVAGAMAEAHKKGVVHRDFYGRNILYFQDTGKVTYIDPETWVRIGPKGRTANRAKEKEIRLFLNELKIIEKRIHGNTGSGLEHAFRNAYEKTMGHDGSGG